jgi:hypothetical protein
MPPKLGPVIEVTEWYTDTTAQRELGALRANGGRTQ